jgi:hypothetical protein
MNPTAPQSLNAPRSASRGGSVPNVVRWLGDIRQYFPASVVQVMQRDALQRRDAHPARDAGGGAARRAPGRQLVSLSKVIPAGTRETARRVVRKVVDELILCIDQSGSMAASVVYSSIFGAVLASLPAVATRLVVFDTAVVDLTEQLQDPGDLLFGVQLGGGTDIERAVAYCQGLIREPRNTIFVLISDL